MTKDELYERYCRISAKDNTTYIHPTFMNHLITLLNYDGVNIEEIERIDKYSNDYDGFTLFNFILYDTRVISYRFLDEFLESYVFSKNDTLIKDSMYDNEADMIVYIWENGIV